ncbi:hypothetical protein MIND_01377600 [Mycena indigotica]|uniref:Uncharacterized protein n=1 Tax=Mycena indigotica TaxID=2126181 RepID=A0A8H6S0Q9_9AGAR|nr:uncharacterized protein MIND_01377600 [Mycena indigotica]KAF7289165.1 hypothetical protein MIND_01377600 [Mycena indigotica]
MESDLEQLRAHIRATGFNSPVANATISAYIRAHILEHPNKLFTTRAPPLDIILFAINNIFVGRVPPPIDSIPDLLDLLTSAEFYRKIALEKANEALKLHLKYKDTSPTRTRLTDEEEQQLRGHGERDENLRSIYLELYHQFATYHMYELWTCHPPRPADMIARFCEYYPETPWLHPHTEALAHRLFCHDLSPAERAECRQRGLDMCKFMTDSSEWAQKNYPGVLKSLVYQKPEFRAEMPCEVDQLRPSLDYYTNTVEAMVNELQDMFQSDPPSPTMNKRKGQQQVLTRG